MVRKKWIVQYNRTVTVRIGHVTIRTDVRTVTHRALML